MKKLWSILCVCAMIVGMLPMISLPVSAATSGDFEYEVTNGTAAITGYTGSATNLTIPSKLRGYPVTSIRKDAFFDCDSLISVTIPNSVTRVGCWAFYGCSSLKKITIGTGVRDLGEGAFQGCRSLQSVKIPDGVESIEWGLFSDCSSLKSVIIPSSVKGIGRMAFSGCDSIADVYYCGTRAQWSDINWGFGNDPLAFATFHYNCSFAKITGQSATTAYASKNKVASVKVTAKGDGLKYTWYIKNPGGTKYAKSSVTSATYSAKMTAPNSGRYAYCIVKDKYGNQVRSKTFELRVKVAITSQSATVAYAKKGATASVKVGATGVGLKYTWYIKNAGQTKYTKSSVTKATYSAKMNSKSKNRLVYCVVKDKHGQSVKSKCFVLREAVSIMAHPKTTTVAKGATAKVTVKASGDGLKYTWYVKDAGKTKYTKSSVTKATYSTTMNSKSKNRLLYCVVKDKYGKSVKTKTVQLKMK